MSITKKTSDSSHAKAITSGSTNHLEVSEMIVDREGLNMRSRSVSMRADDAGKTKASNSKQNLQSKLQTDSYINKR